VVEKLLKNNIITPAFITETLNEDINDIFNKFGFDDPKAVIFYGIKAAVRGNGRTWKFIYNRLEYWRKQGVHTVADAERLESEETSRRTHQIQHGKHGPQLHQEIRPEWMDKPQQEKPPEDPEEVKRNAKKLEKFLNSI
jgi:DnaD/phage-associated family protein